MVNMDQVLGSLTKIRLKGGVVGNVVLLLIFLMLIVGVICFTAKNIYVTLTLMTPCLLLIFYGIKRSFDFAEKNPYAALMEGAELLAHEQLKLGSKAKPNIEFTPSEVVPDHEGLLPSSTSNPDPNVDREDKEIESENSNPPNISGGLK